MEAILYHMTSPSLIHTVVSMHAKTPRVQVMGALLSIEEQLNLVMIMSMQLES